MQRQRDQSGDERRPERQCGDAEGEKREATQRRRGCSSHSGRRCCAQSVSSSAGGCIGSVDGSRRALPKKRRSGSCEGPACLPRQRRAVRREAARSAGGRGTRAARRRNCSRRGRGRRSRHGCARASQRRSALSGACSRCRSRRRRASRRCATISTRRRRALCHRRRSGAATLRSVRSGHKARCRAPSSAASASEPRCSQRASRRAADAHRRAACHRAAFGERSCKALDISFGRRRRLRAPPLRNCVAFRARRYGPRRSVAAAQQRSAAAGAQPG